MSVGVIASHAVVSGGGGGSGTWSNHVNVLATGASSHTVDPSNPTAVGTVKDGTAFTPTAGRLLVCFVGAAVTTSTPTGWTLPAGGSSVNGQALYAFYKTAAGSDTLGPVTHNSNAYPVTFDFYEFASPYAFAAVTNLFAASGQTETMSGLTGTNIVLTAVTSTNTVGTWSYTNATAQVDVDTSPSTGHHYGLAYSTVSTSSIGVAATLQTHQQVMFAVK